MAKPPNHDGNSWPVSPKQDEPTPPFACLSVLSSVRVSEILSCAPYNNSCKRCHCMSNWHIFGTLETNTRC